MEMELLGVASTVLTTQPFVSQARAMARNEGGRGLRLGYHRPPDSDADLPRTPGTGRHCGAASDAAFVGPVREPLRIVEPLLDKPINWDKKFCGRVDSEEDSFKSVGAQQVSRFIFTENNFGDGAPFRL